MKNPYYNMLPIEEKAYLLCSRGELIAATATNNYDMSLYVLDGEYVELFYSTVYNKIEEIKFLEDNQRLDLYTKNMDLSNLMGD